MMQFNINLTLSDTIGSKLNRDLLLDLQRAGFVTLYGFPKLSFQCGWTWEGRAGWCMICWPPLSCSESLAACSGLSVKPLSASLSFLSALSMLLCSSSVPCSLFLSVSYISGYCVTESTCVRCFCDQWVFVSGSCMYVKLTLGVTKVQFNGMLVFMCMCGWCVCVCVCCAKES